MLLLKRFQDEVAHITKDIQSELRLGVNSMGSLRKYFDDIVREPAMLGWPQNWCLNDAPPKAIVGCSKLR